MVFLFTLKYSKVVFLAWKKTILFFCKCSRKFILYLCKLSRKFISVLILIYLFEYFWCLVVCTKNFVGIFKRTWIILIFDQKICFSFYSFFFDNFFHFKWNVVGIWCNFQLFCIIMSLYSRILKIGQNKQWRWNTS